MECYEEFGYELIEHYGGLYPAFEDAAINEDALEEEGFKGKWIRHFVDVAKENIVPPYVKISGYLELTTTAPDGIEKIKRVLGEIEKEDVIVTYVGAPRYRITVKAEDYKTAEDILQNAAKRAIENLENMGGEGGFHRRL